MHYPVPMRAGIITALILLVTASSAHARTQLRTQTGQIPQPYANWIDRSKVPTPPVRISVTDISDCPRFAGACALLDPTNYRIGMHPSIQRFVLLHEVGHIFDHEVMDRKGRDEFASLVRPRRWDGELFADAYASCARPTRAWIQNYGWNPHTKRHRKACGVIRAAYGRYKAHN